MTTFTVRLTEADFVAAYRLLGRRSRRQARPAIALATILAAVLVALVALFPDARAAFARSPLLAGLLGAVLLAAGLLGALVAALPVLTRRAARLTLAEHPGLAEPVDYTIDDEAFAVRTVYSAARYPWGKLHGWRECERVLVVQLTRQLFYVVPKDRVEPAALERLRGSLIAAADRPKGAAR